MKNCPHCQTAKLQPTRYHGEEVDVCRQCGGLWFDKGELDQVLAAADDDYDKVEVESAPGYDLGKTTLKCPTCSELMVRNHLLPGYEVEVDRCPNGHGLWIDKDELEETHNASQLHSHLGQLNGKVNWKTWVFQFLTQMPVEYNIKPKRRPWMTWLLVLVNSLIFIAGILSPELGELFYGGAMVPNEVSHGEHLSALISSQFLHGSWMHLIGNMYFLWLTGDNLEDALGHWRFLGLYLLCGLAAALAQTLIDPASVIPTIGASGAIAGLFGMYLLWFRKASITFMFFVYQKKLPPWVFFLIWVGINILGMATGGQGVAYMAHLGGFAAGLLLGWALLGWVRRRYPVLLVLDHPKLMVSR
ncbi:MAG: rhomboid family intramembrane serine protease [Pseudomonadota bacterium]|uniref:Membrane associated rhomboid family serine protease n=1 Tax=Gallaecimonas pentaromativorans TaxID=584787 RepID=A0A3N1P0B8_9GAMM|nr:rhomboid family intramembrane serine protease [Gallaecimonas pentaromativorans]MED5525696.1 rhomboid family intramembrane serine protease [Pseudomonadota bacterium]ROQ21905.1 membrane associated rhomboid family serine protease [Gallaecimonas pentaromativorans]